MPVSNNYDSIDVQLFNFTFSKLIVLHKHLKNKSKDEEKDLKGPEHLENEDFDEEGSEKAARARGFLESDNQDDPINLFA